MATRYNYTGGIVTNGLVLNLDAAKVDSYPGTGTAWYDISGNNNNGTLTNGPTFSGIGKQASIVFDGVDDYADCGNSAVLNTTSSISINVWFKAAYNPNVIYRAIVDKGRDGFGAWSLAIDEVQTKATFKVVIAGSNRSVTCVSSYGNNIWTLITGVFTGTNLLIYQNGILENSGSFSGTIGTNSISVKIGKPNDTYAFGGNVATTQIYNRALSATEISQNFNALRGRYGI
jgi:hypothetical protein